MNQKLRSLPVILVVFLFAATVETVTAQLPVPSPSPGVTVSQFAANMSFPRGLKFGLDGYLYVAESGFGPPLGEILKVTLPN